MTPDQLVALSIFGAYFSSIVALFVYIWRKLPTQSGTLGARPATFSVLAIVSFVHTWIYMLRFIHWSFSNFEDTHPENSLQSVTNRVANWLIVTPLFEQAWRLVCRGTMNWWWSEQLCIFTAGAWTLFLFDQSRRREIRHTWAFMALGQLVAISVAANLFYLHLSLLPPIAPMSRRRARSDTLPPKVWLSVLLSLFTIGVSPYLSNTSLFLPNLLLMHAVLFAPFILSWSSGNISRNPAERYNLTYQGFAFTVAAISVALRVRSHLTVLQQTHGGYHVPERLWLTLFSNAAQSSIGFDVLYTSGSYLAWKLISGSASQWRGWRRQAGWLVAGVLGSVGPIAAYDAGRDNPFDNISNGTE